MWQRDHKRVMHQCAPYLPWLPADHLTFDILHAVLRIVPVLWRHTIANHLDDAQHQTTCPRFEEKTGIQLSSQSAGQSRSGR